MKTWNVSININGGDGVSAGAAHAPLPYISTPHAYFPRLVIVLYKNRCANKST